MPPFEFEWDEHKNRTNFRDHKIRFEEAQEVFRFPHLTRADPRDYVDQEGNEEIREITTGTIGSGGVIIVAHTDRRGNPRIISARIAEPKERRRFYARLAQTIRGN